MSWNAPEFHLLRRWRWRWLAEDDASHRFGEVQVCAERRRAVVQHRERELLGGIPDIFGVVTQGRPVVHDYLVPSEIFTDVQAKAVGDARLRGYTLRGRHGSIGRGGDDLAGVQCAVPAREVGGRRT